MKKLILFVSFISFSASAMELSGICIGADESPSGLLMEFSKDNRELLLTYQENESVPETIFHSKKAKLTGKLENLSVSGSSEVGSVKLTFPKLSLISEESDESVRVKAKIIEASRTVVNLLLDCQLLIDGKHAVGK